MDIRAYTHSTSTTSPVDNLVNKTLAESYVIPIHLPPDKKEDGIVTREEKESRCYRILTQIAPYSFPLIGSLLETNEINRSLRFDIGPNILGIIPNTPATQYTITSIFFAQSFLVNAELNVHTLTSAFLMIKHRKLMPNWSALKQQSSAQFYCVMGLASLIVGYSAFSDFVNNVYGGDQAGLPRELTIPLATVSTFIYLGEAFNVTDRLIRLFLPASAITLQPGEVIPSCTSQGLSLPIKIPYTFGVQLYSYSAIQYFFKITPDSTADIIMFCMSPLRAISDSLYSGTYITDITHHVTSGPIRQQNFICKWLAFLCSSTAGAILGSIQLQLYKDQLDETSYPYALPESPTIGSFGVGTGLGTIYAFALNKPFYRLFSSINDYVISPVISYYVKPVISYCVKPCQKTPATKNDNIPTLPEVVTTKITDNVVPVPATSHISPQASSSSSPSELDARDASGMSALPLPTEPKQPTENKSPPSAAKQYGNGHTLFDKMLKDPLLAEAQPTVAPPRVSFCQRLRNMFST